MPQKVLRPLKAIRAKCLECCGNSSNEVKLCTAPECPLWPYRFGKRPEIDENGYFTGNIRKRKS